MKKLTHITAGYTALLKKMYKNGNGIIIVENTPNNRNVFKCSNFPFEIKARNINKWFV